MDKEVAPAVLAVINEKRLAGEKRTPVEIITRMGVFDAREKASDHAWLATGGNVIVTVWAEFVSVGSSGRWFYLESLDAERRLDGGERTALQAQRAKDRIGLVKQAHAQGQRLRAVLQTNRVAIAGLESDKAAKVAARVPDDEEWHVATWDADAELAVLVRGAPGWQPTEAELDAARARGGVPPVVVVAPVPEASHDEAQAAAMAYLVRHFGGYGYQAEDVRSQNLGYDIAVSDKKGNRLLQIAVKGTAPGVPSFQLTPQERASAARGDPWRLAVVTDATGPTVQHKLYKPAEIDTAPGLEPPSA